MATSEINYGPVNLSYIKTIIETMVKSEELYRRYGVCDSYRDTHKFIVYEINPNYKREIGRMLKLLFRTYKEDAPDAYNVGYFHDLHMTLINSVIFVDEMVGRYDYGWRKLDDATSHRGGYLILVNKDGLDIARIALVNIDCEYAKEYKRENEKDKPSKEFAIEADGTYEAETAEVERLNMGLQI